MSQQVLLKPQSAKSKKKKNVDEIVFQNQEEEENFEVEEEKNVKEIENKIQKVAINEVSDEPQAKIIHFLDPQITSKSNEALNKGQVVQIEGLFNQIEKIEQLISLIETFGLNSYYIKQFFQDDVSYIVTKFLQHKLSMFIKNNKNNTESKQVNKDGYLSHTKSITPIKVNPQHGYCGFKIRLNLDYDAIMGNNNENNINIDVKKELSEILECDSKYIDIKKKEKGSLILTVVIVSFCAVVGAICGAFIGSLIAGPPGMIIGGAYGIHKGAAIGGAVGVSVGCGVGFATRKSIVRFWLTKHASKEDSDNYFKTGDYVTVIKNGFTARIVAIHLKENRKPVIDIQYTEGNFFTKNDTIYDPNELESSEIVDAENSGEFITDGTGFTFSVKRSSVSYQT